jgi:lactoylglutathione lyase
MKIKRTGLIINTENYKKCVKFYQEIFNLKVLFQKSKNNFALTCFEFGNSYLLVETGGYSESKGKSIQSSLIKIRFNVDNCDSTLQYLKNKGINARIERFDWGSNINIFDPDGNRIGISDEKMFNKEIKEARDVR